MKSPPIDSDPCAATPLRTPFEQTMCSLGYAVQGASADLFSITVVEEFDRLDDKDFGYRLAQVFEPDVLREVAVLAGIPYADLAELRHLGSPVAHAIAERVHYRNELRVAQLVNTATALISVSRFDLAERLIRCAREAEANPRERFEVAMLEFVVANRRDDGRGSPKTFVRMRDAITSASLPIDRELDACSQAVVWFLKRQELDEADFVWFLARGQQLAQTREAVPTAALSSWFRAAAMVPASRGYREETRALMNRAGDTALQCIAADRQPFRLHLLKTYYESSIKEHMHVSRDAAAAEEFGLKLIGMDPTWAPSYAALAEAHLHFGNIAPAAALYENAVALGPPYQGLHRLAAANCRGRLGDFDAALHHLLGILGVEHSEPMEARALELARRIDHPVRFALEHQIAQRGPTASQATVSAR